MKRRTIHNFDGEFNTLEARLAGTLKRVSPPNDLMRRLHERIRLPARKEIVLRIQDWNRLFLIFGGVMSGMVALITVARALFHLARRPA